MSKRPRRTKPGATLTLDLQLEYSSLPAPEHEHRFHPTRRWRFDFAWPDYKLAAEIEGATWTQGRHTRGQGFENDCTKYNEAAVLGWAVLRFTTEMVRDGRAFDTIARWFEAHQ